MKMLSFVIRYYCSGWKQAAERNKTENNSVAYMPLIVFLTLLTDGWTTHSGYGTETVFSAAPILWCYVLLIPIFLGIVHVGLYPNGMEKTLFLCPIGRERIKRFLYTAYYFRISCVLVLSFLVSGILVLLGEIRISWYFLGFFLSEGMLASIVFLKVNGITWENARKKGLGHYAAYTVCEVFGCISGIFSLLIFGIEIINYTGGAYPKFDVAVLLVVFMIQAAFSLKIKISYQKKIMEIAADYEKASL